MMKKYEAVISGISGMFPECSSVQELEKKCYTSENLVTRMDSNIKIGDKSSAPYTGFVKEEPFDHTFFGVNKGLAEAINHFHKYCLNHSYKAICDAGLSPEEVKGTNTAVYTTSMLSETDGSLVTGYSDSIGMLAYATCMNANRVSYYLNLHGPSINVLSSWTGSMEVLQSAAEMVEAGKVKMVIVAGLNKLYLPFFSIHYDGMKHLSVDGKTRSFSADAHGYNRSDGWVVLVIQRAEDARRSYGSVVKVSNAQMLSQPSHFTDPLGFGDFIKDFYSDVDIKTDDIAYIECDGSASKVLDAAELNGLSKALCAKRKRPLLVSSCKSRLGHTEAAAGLVSLAQALIAMKNGIIPSTLHYTAPNPAVPALLDGTIKVVTENTPLEGDYVGVTIISLINAYGHALIKRNPKSRAPRSLDYFPADDIPRIFLLSGRDLDAMNNILNSVLEKPVDENYYALNHNVFKKGIPNHLRRGFTVKGENKTALRSGEYCDDRKPVWYIFTGMGCQWPAMGAGLLKLPVTRRSLERSAKVLATKGIDLMYILTSLDPTIFDDILNSFVGIAAIQIALTDLLEELGVVPDGIVGHSTGEIGCAYADKCLTAEQALLTAYGRGKSSNEAPLIKGMMAAVGMGYNQIKDFLPEGIYGACHNSSTSCTLSGPVQLMEEYVAKLKNDGVFAKLVNVSNIAYHTKFVHPAAAYYTPFLEEVIPNPTLRSSKWISSSVPEDKWNTDEGRYCSSQYFVNNLMNYVLFEEATQHIPDNAICIEIAPHGLLQAIVKKSLPECIHIPLTHRKDNGTFYLIEAIGGLFMQGVDVEVAKLYPPVEFPVPRETEFLDVITWHAQENISTVGEYNKMYIRRCGFSSECWKQVTLTSRENNYVQNNQFKGSPYHPKAKLLMALLEIELENNKEASRYLSYSFQNLELNHDLLFDVSDDMQISCLLQPGTKHFEVIHNIDSLMSGCLTGSLLALPDVFTGSDFVAHQRKQAVLRENEIYEFFQDMGYDLTPPFRNIIALTIFDNGFSAKVEWKNNFELYLESIFKIIELYESIRTDSVVFLHTIEQLLVDRESFPKSDRVIDVYYDGKLKFLTAQGIRLFWFKTKTWAPDSSSRFELKTKHFMPYSKLDSKMDFIDSCLEIIRENCRRVQLVVDQSSPSSKAIAQNIDSTDPTVKYQLVINIKEKVLEENDHHTYVLIGDRGSLNEVEKLIDARVPFYFIYTGSGADIRGKLSQHLTCIIDQQKDQQITLYKQKKSSLEEFEFIDMGDARNSGETVLKQQGFSNKICFHVYRYRFLSDVVRTLQLTYYKTTNTRLVFLDEYCDKFNANSDFYEQQLLRDLKVNVAMRGVWGSLRDNTVAQVSQTQLTSSYPLSSLRCSSVDLEVIGINLKSLVHPDKYRKIGVIEYSGVKNGKQVFGLGRLVEGNYLETDPALCWEKPKQWSMEDAATIPLYYTMAYDMLKVRGRRTLRIRKSLLIHAGHTPFSQAVISVALSLQMEVFTTCYSTLQKQFILKKYPQIKANHVFIITGEYDDTFADSVMKITGGKGPYLIIDNLEITTLRIETSRCGVPLGFYYLLTTDDMDDSFNFGMGLTEKDVGVYGYNPEMIFDMQEEDKLLIGELIQEGIKTQIVEPLPTHNLPPTLTPSQAADSIVVKSREEFPVKFIMPVKEPVKQLPVSTRHLKKDKSALIIGGDKGIWFDLVKWLVSKGVNSVHVLLHQNRVPHNLKLRFGEFALKHKYINLSVGELENLDSVKKWSEVMSSIQPAIDSVFYIEKGVKNDLSIIDKALRAHGKDTCLFTLGSQVPHVSEIRNSEGLRSVSFILASDKLKNISVINCLDHWLERCTKNDHVIEVQKLKHADDVSRENENILPESGWDLVELGRGVSKEASLVEITTRCQPMKLAHDVDPVFLFPGLQLNKTKQFGSRFYNPTFMATYPLYIKSIHQLASEFAKIIIEKFDNNLFTLVAEGWAGPLVLTIATLLEKYGKASSVLLLNAAPITVKQWKQHQDSFLVNHLPYEAQSMMNTEILRRNSEEVSRSVCRESGGELIEKEVDAGLESLISRLEAVENYTTDNQTLHQSSVHLFTSSDVLKISLFKMCAYFYRQITVKTSGCMLEDKSLVDNVNDLFVHEFKVMAKRPDIKDISTLKLMHDIIVESQI